MSASKIEWTDRSDWNPIRGCTRVSPGCGGPGDHGGCYAEGMAARFSLSAAEVEAKWHADPKNQSKTPPVFKDQWGHGFAEMQGGKPRWTGKVELQADRLAIPLSWRKPQKVFANSTSDFFHEALSDDDLDKLFAHMALCPHITFQVLTKRPERARAYLTSCNRDGIWYEMVQTGMRSPDDEPNLKYPLPNVWIGTSCERQQEADERIPHLLQTPAAIRFVSAEPLLGPIDFTHIRIQLAANSFMTRSALYAKDSLNKGNPEHALDWIIVGGESGHNARPFNIEWADSIIAQCKAADVACFVKQLGAVPLSSGYPMHLKSKKGADWSEWPDRLRVREFPKVPG